MRADSVFEENIVRVVLEGKPFAGIGGQPGLRGESVKMLNNSKNR
jgi:hypothetical protein